MGRIDSILRRLQSGLLIFRADGRLIAATRSILQQLGFATSQNIYINQILDGEAYQDLFEKLGPDVLQNYRAYVRNADQKVALYQISAHREQSKDVCLHLQLLNLPDQYIVDTGPFLENVRSHQLLRRYVSPQVLGGVQAAIRQGLDRIPDESSTLTFMFADLVGFTGLAEKSTSEEIVHLLNLSIGANSSTVLHWGGFIDKIMGDSIFAVFGEPIYSVIAAIEMQKQFNILNFFRIKEGEDPIEMRIGIHTGQCTVASIGADEFLELTYIGDSVNIAARLEKQALPGSILVSNRTVEQITENITVGAEIEMLVKGKLEPVRARPVMRVEFTRDDGRKMTIGIDDDIF